MIQFVKAILIDHENYLPLLYFCSKNREAGEAVLRVAKAYDRNCTPEKSLRFEVQTDEVFTLSSISILATGLLFIWENRKQIKKTTLYMMRAQLEAVVSIRRLKKIREAGDIMYKLMNNMVIVNRVQNSRHGHGNRRSISAPTHGFGPS